MEYIMSNIENKCYFCGCKLGLNDSFDGDENGHIFCDRVCLLRFDMGDKDNCANCNKKIVHYLLKSIDKKNNDNFYFCSESCFKKYNDKRTKNKLERISSVCGGRWD